MALRHRRTDAALRLIDRAWRSAPRNAPTLAPLYGRLLMLDDRHPDAALRVLSRIETPDADVAALMARAQGRLRRADDARRGLDAALRAYCLLPESLLAQEAAASLESPDMRAAGWVGLGPTLEFVGELAPGHSADALLIQSGGRTVAPALHVDPRDRRTRFSFPAPRGGERGANVIVSSRGVPLLGSGHRVPVDFLLDGRMRSQAGGLSGWVRIGWLPTEPVELRFEDEHGNCTQGRTADTPLPGYRWPYRLNLRSSGLRGQRIALAARLPDGRWQELPDSPFLLSRAMAPGAGRERLPRWRTVEPGRTPRAAAPRRKPVDVVIPVYRGVRETLACVDSVLATVPRDTGILVINDASPEPELSAGLEALATAGRICLLRNETNLGFVRTVNRALAECRGHDVVLLNSDTLVFGDWLERLRKAAYAGPRVGTVTPFSNDGSIVSYPRRFGGPLGAVEAEQLSRLAGELHQGITAEIPVGVGFCLFMRHDCVAQVGELDATAFGVGYGEESDFCLRARAQGWSHQLAADVFVYHASGGSFGSRRAALWERSQRLLNLRYPGYDRYVTEFLNADSLLRLRRDLDEKRLSTLDARCVLLVTLALEGGVERFVNERKQQLRDQGLIPITLKPTRPGDLRHCELTLDTLDAPNLRYSIPSEMEHLEAVLKKLPLERVEIQHFLDLNPRVIEAVRGLGVPYDVMIHDYAWICPRITLIDGSGKYCGEPDVTACASCLRRNGSRLPKNLSAAALRERSATWLAEAQTVSAPSRDTALRMQRYFTRQIEVRPHTAPAAVAGAMPLAGPPARERLRVGLIGAIGSHKGYRVLLECARDAAARDLPLEFVVIGYTEDDKTLARTRRVEITGRYVDAETQHLIRREQPDLIFLPSVWPETWCYALDHALAARIPTVAFDIGALTERLQNDERHALLPLDTSAGEINDRLIATARQQNAGVYVQTSEPAAPVVPNIPEDGVTKAMKPMAAGQDEALSASLQVLPLVPGLYLFSVTSSTPPGERSGTTLNLPAMHVGLGPGVDGRQVEFVGSPGTEGAWLFAHGDMLVAKVVENATLVLTSVRAANGDVLSIEVERLGNRAPAVAAAIERTAAAPAVESEPEPRAAAPQPAAAANSTPDDGQVPLQISTHIRSRGDVSFTDAPWAGRVAPGLWMESFSVQPLKHLGARDVEYKGLTGTGFETPWLSDAQNCGTKGMSVPLVGFAVRLKPGPQTAQFDCEYSGYFHSGTVVGPVRNGAPCRSTVANDPLEGIQIRFVRRATVTGTGKPGSAIRPATDGRPGTSATARKPEAEAARRRSKGEAAGPGAKAEPGRQPGTTA
ncbi:MAG: glycosyltransferase [Proteobacteria bacterium]|nr:glycosyltransferase [Pseudomonadota bacterium]